MIEYIHGEIAELLPTMAVVEAAGVGYGLNISLTTYNSLKGGKEAKLFVYENIREDAYVLYGFATKDERAVFVSLLAVSGVGGNTARTILSAFSPDEFRTLVASGNAAALKSVKGIGAKTAQRIIVELKDKIGEVPDLASATATGVGGLSAMQEAAAEAVGALITLGYQGNSAQKAINTILKGSGSDVSAEELVKLALKML